MNPIDLVGRKVRIGRGKKVWVVDELDRQRDLLYLTVDDPGNLYAATTTIPVDEADRLHVVEEVRR